MGNFESFTTEDVLREVLRDPRRLVSNVKYSRILVCDIVTLITKT